MGARSNSWPQGRTGGQGAARPRPISRRTGRPAKHIPNAVAVARRLTKPETLEKLHLTDADIAFLDQCAAGRPPRNALAAITAIKLKLEYTASKPKQLVEHEGVVRIVVETDAPPKEFDR